MDNKIYGDLYFYDGDVFLASELRDTDKYVRFELVATSRGQESWSDIFSKEEIKNTPEIVYIGKFNESPLGDAERLPANIFENQETVLKWAEFIKQYEYILKEQVTAKGFLQNLKERVEEVIKANDLKKNLEKTQENIKQQELDIIYNQEKDLTKVEKHEEKILKEEKVLEKVATERSEENESLRVQIEKNIQAMPIREEIHNYLDQFQELNPNDKLHSETAENYVKERLQEEHLGLGDKEAQEMYNDYFRNNKDDFRKHISYEVEDAIRDFEKDYSSSVELQMDDRYDDSRDYVRSQLLEAGVPENEISITMDCYDSQLQESMKDFDHVKDFEKKEMAEEVEKLHDEYKYDTDIQEKESFEKYVSENIRDKYDPNQALEAYYESQTIERKEDSTDNF